MTASRRPALPTGFIDGASFEAEALGFVQPAVSQSWPVMIDTDGMVLMIFSLWHHTRATHLYRERDGASVVRTAADAHRSRARMTVRSDLRLCSAGQAYIRRNVADAPPSLQAAQISFLAAVAKQQQDVEERREMMMAELEAVSATAWVQRRCQQPSEDNCARPLRYLPMLTWK